MKERSGPHYVGQQLAFLSPQEYPTGKLTNDILNGTTKPVLPFSNIQQNSSLSVSGGPVGLGVSNQIMSLNVVQYPPQQPIHQLPHGLPRKKFAHGGSGSVSGGHEQRQMNLAEMVRSSNIIKQSQFPSSSNQHSKNGFISQNQQNLAGEFIKGTQFNKDFQLIAEPIIIPKQHQHQTQQLQHNNSSQNHHPHNLKAQSSTSQSQITYSNTAISSNLQAQEKQSTDGSSLGGGGGTVSLGYNNNFSNSSSKKNLDGYYSSSNSKSNYVEGSIIQNPAIQHLMLQSQQQSQHYSTNRSVATKAGQMQIFSNDKYSHLSSNHSTQNTKGGFTSPPKQHSTLNGKLLHHQSASQQIENIIDLQQQQFTHQRLKSNNGGQNQKYTDYLNRFSTSHSIEQTQNLQLKYRDLRQQILDDDSAASATTAMMMKYQHGNHYPPLIDSESTPLDMISGGTKANKSSPVSIQSKENRLLSGIGLGVSGEQMHLEEKTFLKKMGLIVANSIEGVIGGGTSNGQNSHRQPGSSRKRQDMQINARGFRSGYRQGVENQPHALQPKTRYDYVFIRMTDEQFEKEFQDKIIFSRDQGADQHSPTTLSFQNKRGSSMVNNSAKKEDGTPSNSQQQTIAIPGGPIVRNQKSVRGSQDLSRETNFFSPITKASQQAEGGANGIQDLITIQNLQPSESKSPQMQHPATPKASSNVCSIISTNHTHIKVIANQGFITGFGGLTQEQKNQQQQALNDCVQDVMNKVQDKGRIVKTTMKKKYVVNALIAAHLRVASIYVIVLDNAISTPSGFNTAGESDMRATLMSDSSTTSSNNFNSTLTKLGNPKAQTKHGLKKDQQFIIKNQDQIPTAKNMRIRNNSTLNSKGYESESEAKSTNSTTTSSTLQHFIPTRNFDQNGGSNTTKNSSRSLSQKGNQPRKNFQKVQGQQQQAMDQEGCGEKVSITPYQMLKDANAKKYPPTKIKIVSPYDYTHHDNHRINICLNNYNNFIQLCFKQKGKINMPALVKLGKQLGIPVNQSMFTDGVIKNREQANMIKEKLIAYLCRVINEENQPDNMPDNPLVQEAIQPLNQPVHQYKCFVGKGNNSILIRTLFKTRFWWLLHDKEEIEKVNFMWTQLRKNQIMDTFPCKFEDKKSGLRSTQGNQNSSSAMQTPGKLKHKKKMQLQNSCMSLESSGGGSNDKKDTKGGEKDQPQIIQQQSNQISPALQQLSVKLYNKLEDNFHLSNKKAMFLNIRLFYEAMNKDVFNAVPMTFHIKEGLDDAEFLRFKAFYMKEEEEVKKQRTAKGQAKDGEVMNEEASQLLQASTKRNIWIVKPGENTNRGQGITVLKDFEEIKAIIQESTANKKRTCIVQKYIHNPLLINKRKFDIRLYAFMSSVNGNMKGYFYADGYLRTSCREFTLQNLSNRMIHLTNDAVQKHAEDYGKYEAGNKLSYTDFQNYLDKNYADLNICFERDLLPQMKKLVTDTFRAVYGKLDPKRRLNTFEIYGYDFMFDDDFKVYLIEVNTNPCLELGCPLLARLIPTMVENALRLVVDPLFPAPENWSQKKCVVNDICPENKFELIFDCKIDGPYLNDLMKEKNNIIIEIDEEELSDNDNVDEKEECEIP